jgi:hypothetical protein
MDEQLGAKLEKLQDELDRAKAGDADAQARVEDVRQDVQAALARDERAPKHQVSLLERLRNAIPFFESTHPSLTLAMSEVVDELARMGF